MKIRPLKHYTPWYDKPVLVIVLLFLVPVVGLYGIIRTTVISKQRKIIWLLGFLAFIFLLCILADLLS